MHLFTVSWKHKTWNKARSRWNLCHSTVHKVNSTFLSLLYPKPLKDTHSSWLMENFLVFTKCICKLKTTSSSMVSLTKCQWPANHGQLTDCTFQVRDIHCAEYFVMVYLRDLLVTGIYTYKFLTQKRRRCYNHHWQEKHMS